MATNEDYRRGIKIPLTVGASVAARTPVVVGKLPALTLRATGSSGTTRATCLVKGIVDLLVDGACDAVTLTLASMLNTQTIIFDGVTYTATTSTTTWSTRSFSIAGNDAADAALLCKAINGGKLVTLASVTAGQTVVVNGLTFTGHATTTTAANREFAINGTDAQDAAALVTCLNDATYGIGPYVATQSSAGEILIQPPSGFPTSAYPEAVVSSSSGTLLAVSTLAPPAGVRASVASAVVTLTSNKTISAVTGTGKSGGTVTDAHDATSTRIVSPGDIVYWTTGTPNVVDSKAESGTRFGYALELIEDRKMTLASVTNGTTVVINDVVFTAHTNTTTRSSRQFAIDGDDTADAVALCGCINDPVYGIRGMTASNNAGVITLDYDGDIVISGTARVAGTLTTAPGSRTIQVKLGY